METQNATDLAELLKSKFNITDIGNRVMKRLHMLIDVSRIDEYQDSAIRTAIYLCSDIKYAHKDHTRSQKVMAYRTANNHLLLLAKIASITGPRTINNLGNHLFSRIYSVPVTELRVEALSLATV
jgi:hypothetical protein